MRKTSIVIAALALSAGACASSPNGQTPEELVGCYYFEQDQTARALNLPWGVQLTPDSLTGWPSLEGPDVRVAVTLRGEDETTDFPFGYWQTLPGDSLRLGYPGTGGFSVRVAVRDDGLEGTARPVGDAGLRTERPVHPVRLVRARCRE